MSDLLQLKDVTDILSRACRNEIALSGSDRVKAQQRLGQLIENRVHIGRRPQGSKVDMVTMRLAAVEHEYTLSGQTSDSQTTVQVMAYSFNRERCWEIAEALRLMFTSFTGTYKSRWDRDVCVGGATFDSTFEPTPEPPEDGSQDDIFEIQQFLRITHEVAVPS